MVSSNEAHFVIVGNNFSDDYLCDTRTLCHSNIIISSVTTKVTIMYHYTLSILYFL